MLMNTGPTMVSSDHGLLTSVGYQLGPTAPVIYCLEGSVAYCGSLIQWLRDNLGLITTVVESDDLAASVPDNGGVFFVPAFAGLFAPYWRDDARGTIVGLTAFNTKAHITRAALEAAGFQTKELVDAMQKDSGINLLVLKVDGGMTHNNVAMQFQSDILGVSMCAPKVRETTACGAAFAAGLAVGLWGTLEEVKATWQREKTWLPRMEEATRQQMVLSFLPTLSFW